MLVAPFPNKGSENPYSYPLEAWGGAECTVNRVGNRFRDQLVETGLDRRPEDLEILASLSLDAVRLPILWERVSPSPLAPPRWAWSDRAMMELRRGGIRPIAGLIHHGSGPAHTSLLDDGFAIGLAEHAARVAERYPDIVEWTPVNEPLTTARFSLLYGIWYPHARDERLFWIALLNQIDAIRLCMRAVRRVRPEARLVQTEDLGRTYATPCLRDQAAFYNERRWMTWDLLCGLVDKAHPLWERLCAFGLETRLRIILDDPCPPSVIGINHYLTSDRFLDDRPDRYPAATLGDDPATAFHDVEAIRVLDPAPRGLARALDDAWKRYRVPIAFTEIHNGCTREEQIRWLSEAWGTARKAQLTGTQIVAVTAWALFGSQGWNTLLTDKGVYEAGAFDTSSGGLRETALAQAIRRRGRGAEGEPWWRRGIRLAYPAVSRPAPIAEHRAQTADGYRMPLLILGASGSLGQALAAECRHRDLAYVLTGRPEVDLLDSDSVALAIDRYRPWAVANAAGWVRVDDAEDNPQACRATNSDGAIAVAGACARAGVPSLNFSTDLVFDGSNEQAYVESDAPNPLNAYGRSKLAMEEGLASLAGQHLIVRTAAFFSPHDLQNFAIQCLASLERRERFVAASDCAVTPTYLPDLCRVAIDLLIDRETGVWHLTSGEAVTWHAFARRLAQATGTSDGSLIAMRAQDTAWVAARPGFSALASVRGQLMPDLGSAIARFASIRSAQRAPIQ